MCNRSLPYSICLNLLCEIFFSSHRSALWTALSQEGEGEGEQNECFCNNLDPVHLIWTKVGMDIQLDPRNKSVKEFFIFLKIQDGRRWSKVQNRSNLTPQFTFRLRIWIRLIWFGQYLALAYYLTLETSLRMNFSFFSKSKMAAGGQKSEIGQILPHNSHFGSSFGSGSSDLD